MATPEIVFKMAFSFLKKKVSVEMLRYFEEKEISPELFFTLPTKELVNKLAIRHDHEFDQMNREEAFTLARIEWDNIKNHNIKPLYVLDENYPTRLSEIFDPPVILYQLGDAELENEHIISIVGTRKPTPYGVDFCNKFVDELSGYFSDSMIVSGLAYGIDSVAHAKAIEKGLTTVAVVAHGLNMIYPAANRSLAKKIVKEGGAILSEYPFGTQPFKGNFLARNRIVAGLADVTLIVESNIKGGAMSTANFAFQYNREVLALPGRVTDSLSSGCNHLIRKNKAHLVACVADLLEVTDWQPLNIHIDARERNLFPELDGDSKKIYEILKYSSNPLQMDQLVHATGIHASSLLALLSELEFNGIIIRHPGNRYSIS